MKLIKDEKVDHYFVGRSVFSDAWLRVYEPGNSEIPYVAVLTELPDRSPSIAEEIDSVTVAVMRGLPDPGRGAVIVEHHIQPEGETFDFVRFGGLSNSFEALPVTVLRREKPQVGIFTRSPNQVRPCRVVVRRRIERSMVEQLVGQRL